MGVLVLSAVMAMADGLKEEVMQPKTGKNSKRGWLWPLGVVATSMAGVGVLMLRGCWHRRMSWPVRVQGHSYQVCLDCGVKRLFDEKGFRSYGPFRYDLQELIAWHSAQLKEMAEREAHRTAS